MKKYFFPIIIALTGILFSACSGDDDDNQFILMSAPNWHYADKSDHTASMTAIIKLPESLGASADSADQMAAFIGGECRGVAMNYDGAFFLMVKAEPSESGKVTVKYYSAVQKKIFEAAGCFNFEPDATHGTVDEPLELQFVPSK